MLKHVLIPLDGSPLAEKVIDTVKHILPPGGKMTLLTAVPNREQLPTVHVESGDVPQSIEIVGHGTADRVVNARTWIRVAGHDNAVGLRQGERLEEDAADDRKERGIRPDAHSQGHRSCDGERSIFPEETQADAKIVEHASMLLPSSGAITLQLVRARGCSSPRPGLL